MPTFAPFSRVRSVKLPTFKRHPSPPRPSVSTSASTSSNTSPSPRSHTSRNPSLSRGPRSPKDNISEAAHRPNPRLRTASSPTSNSFAETLRVISKEAQSGRFSDVFDAFFFTDKRCQNRAFFMAARLKQTLLPLLNSNTDNNHNDALWRLITYRLYTFNYILFVLPATCEDRLDLLSRLETELAQQGDGQDLHRSGGMEAHFAVRYALCNAKRHRQRQRRRRTLLEDAFEAEKAQQQQSQLSGEEDVDYLVSRARQTLEHCLKSESKLGPTERDAMYVFHGMRVGLHGAFEPKIELGPNESQLSQRLHQAVIDSQAIANLEYVNPFEDSNCIVTEDEDQNEDQDEDKSYTMIDVDNNHQAAIRPRSFVDSKFYEVQHQQPTAVRYAS
ncbi:hypothetical protein F4703DRAFT_1831272 [Phycomyces blakesleeanus]